MITIIIPTVDKTTQRDAIRSVEEQTSNSWKIILGGDGFMPEFRSEDGRIEVVEVPRQGEAGLMRNYLGQMVDTEWVGFLDDDDELDKRYVEIFEKSNEDCDVMIFNMLNYGEVLPPLGNRDIQHGRVGISFAMKTEVFKDYPFDGHGASEDYRMLYNLKNNGLRIKFLDFVGYYVRPWLRS